MVSAEEIALAAGGHLTLWREWMLAEEGARLVDQLIAEVDWRQDEIRIAGKTYLQPRLSAWFGDPGARYTYSGLTLEPQSWHPAIAVLKSRIEATTKHRFNSVLANYYRDGNDSMGLHADNEPELGEDPVIASLSLGAQRKFVLRYTKRPRGTIEPVELMLGEGTLLLMSGTTQRFYKHEVPKRKSGAAARINLTFRLIHQTRLA